MCFTIFCEASLNIPDIFYCFSSQKFWKPEVVHVINYFRMHRCDDQYELFHFEGSGGVPFTQLELLEATHRGLHKFIPRHHDEIDLEIGDPIYVQKEADDLWCEGAWERISFAFFEISSLCAWRMYTSSQHKLRILISPNKTESVTSEFCNNDSDIPDNNFTCYVWLRWMIIRVVLHSMYSEDKANTS